jgi:hypothetical protein
VEATIAEDTIEEAEAVENISAEKSVKCALARRMSTTKIPKVSDVLSPIAGKYSRVE